MEEHSKQNILERAVFGSWDGVHRDPGLLEQATFSAERFTAIDKQFHQVKVAISHHEKVLKALCLLCILPALSALGIETKNLVPYIIKNILPIIGL